MQAGEHEQQFGCIHFPETLAPRVRAGSDRIDRQANRTSARRSVEANGARSPSE